MSFQSQKNPKLLDFSAWSSLQVWAENFRLQSCLKLKLIILAPKTFCIYISCIWEIIFENFERFPLKWSNFIKFWARFFFMQVRISPEINWYHYACSNAAPTTIVWHQIKTDQFWWNVIPEPTVSPLHHVFSPQSFIFLINGVFGSKIIILHLKISG